MDLKAQNPKHESRNCNLTLITTALLGSQSVVRTPQCAIQPSQCEFRNCRSASSLFIVAVQLAIRSSQSETRSYFVICISVSGIGDSRGAPHSLWLLPCSQDVVGPDVPEQDDFLLPLEGNSVAFGHAHLPDIPCALYLLHPERRMAGVVLV